MNDPNSLPSKLTVVGVNLTATINVKLYLLFYRELIEKHALFRTELQLKIAQSI